MARTTVRSFWRRLRLYLPFTGSTVIVALAFWGLHRLLYRPPAAKGDEPDALQPFILLMGKATLWFAAALFLLSLLSAVAAWLHFLWLRSRLATPLQTAFRTDAGGRAVLHATLPKAFRPVLGFVTGRLVYDDGQVTDAFPLARSHRRKKKLFREALAGEAPLRLPDIREYELRGAVVYFEDMLRLISLPAHQPLTGQFHQPPHVIRDHEVLAEPRHTETLDVRIDRMKRVEGDLLHYKDFEAGDDVRRIVWSVYARNRDLVVRVPERFEPYASHLYVYASFGASVPAAFDLDSPFFREGLNYYKNRVWTVYQGLAGSNASVRYIPDQDLRLPEALPADERVLRSISHSQWQTAKPLTDYFDAKKGAVLLVSSLTPPEELQEALHRSGSGVIVYFVRLSQAFRHSAALHWSKRLLLRPDDDRLGRLRSRWLFSPLRPWLKKREKALEALLNSSLVQEGRL